MKWRPAGRISKIAALALAIGALIASCGSPSPSPTPTAAASPSASAAATPPPTPTGAASNLSPPSARQLFAAGYDPITRSLLIEGGVIGSPSSGSSPAGETWSWDGAHWHRLADGPAVENASMALDPLTGQLLLIGGNDGHHEPVLAQTGMWSWTGMSWIRVADNPAEGAISQATTDPVHRQVLVNATGPTGACGGSCPTPVAYQQYGHYVWNGSSWRSAPTSTDYHGATGAALGFDPISSRVIQQGDTAQASLDATLEWDGAVWSLLKPDSVDPATAGPFEGTAATDGHLLLMLGDPKTTNHNIASTWSFDGSVWQRHVVNEPSATAYLVYDPAVSAFVAVGFASTSGALDVWVLRDLSTGWQVLAH